MGFARTKLRGVTHYDPSKAYNGYTLFSCFGSRETVLINMQGQVVHRWNRSCSASLYGMLLNNGDLLCAGSVEDGPLAHFRGAGGELLEVDWDGNLVWKYQDPYLHHGFCRLGNGNSLMLRWVPVPKDIAAQVKGGIPGSEQEGIMWGDSFREVNPRGKVVWEWLAHEHLNPEVDASCPLCPRNQWTEANSFDLLPNGDIVVSFQRTNTISIVEKRTGQIRWRWGAGGELGHQNDVTVLTNGNVLLFDNGTHSIHFSQAYSRVLEVNPVSNKMVWEYKDDPWMAFYSAYMSSCQRLPNGNTLVCEAQTGRIFEVTKGGSIVWEFVNPFPALDHPVYGHNRIIPQAYRYGPDYQGLPAKNSKSPAG